MMAPTSTSTPSRSSAPPEGVPPLGLERERQREPEPPAEAEAEAHAEAGRLSQSSQSSHSHSRKKNKWVLLPTVLRTVRCLRATVPCTLSLWLMCKACVHDVRCIDMMYVGNSRELPCRSDSLTATELLGTGR
jgi:hypothetical protein